MKQTALRGLSVLSAALVLLSGGMVARASADPSPSGENLASGGRVTVSTVYEDQDDYAAGKMIDGDFSHGSRWAAADGDGAAEAVFTFGRVKALTGVQVVEDTTHGERIDVLEIEYWDGGGWKRLISCRGGTAQTDTEGRSYRLFSGSFDAIPVQKVRIRFHASVGPAVREVEFLGDPNADITPGRIQVGDQPLSGFDADRLEYDVVIGGDTPPVVTAAEGQVVQADALPGKATVTVGEAPLCNTYTIYFTKDEGQMINTVIDAHKYSQRSGVTDTMLAPDGSSVGNFEEGGYLKYAKVDFAAGEAKVLMMTCSSVADGSLEIRLDAPDGALIGRLDLHSTGSTALFKEHYAQIEQTTGVHDLYIVAAKALPAHLDTFVLSSYAGHETEEERDARMSWWREARYGQFIHFGAYANFPFAEDFTGYGEWVMYNQKISRTRYEDLCVKDFDPTSWDAEKIVSDAMNAGVRYMVFTSKHHEGFSMFDTSIRGFSSFSLMDYGNYTGEDPVLSLSNACKKAGIRFGCYYSIMDWRHWAQNTLGETVNDKAAYIADMKGQLRELIQVYDVDILWFDGEWQDWWTTSDGEELYRYLRTLKPSLVINNRIGKRASTDGDFGTPEQEIPATGLDYDWESCITMNDSWGYVAHDTNWKTVEWIIHSLVSTASKGGNMLLNVGPDPLGVVPEECTARLAEAGEWIKAYGDSIFGTTANPFSAGLGFGTATKKEGKLYLHVTSWPEDGKLLVPALENEIRGVRLLGGRSLRYGEGDGFILIQLPEEAVNVYDTVVEMTVDGLPKEAKTSYLSQNLALSKETEASDVYFNNPDYTGDKATDGDGSTRWATSDETTSATLEVAFGQTRQLNMVSLSECTSWGARIDSFQIEYYDDGEWKTAYAGNGVGESKTVWFDTVSSDRVRLNIVSCYDGITGGPSLYEMQVYHVDADVNWIMRGDMDADGMVSVSDVVELRKAIVGGKTPGAETLATGDLDGDGQLTVSDVVELRQEIVRQ